MSAAAAIAGLALVLTDAPPAPEMLPKPVCTPTGEAAKITSPDWTRKPNLDDQMRVYPAQALKNRIEGKATIECTVTAKGTLETCGLISEEPAGYGFGQATLSLTAKFKMRPCTRTGYPVEGGRVRIPQRWILTD